MTSIDDWELWLRDVATETDLIDEPSLPGAGSRAIDDPWGALDVAITPLSVDQRVFLLDPSTLFAELDPTSAPSTLLPSTLDPGAFAAVDQIDDHTNDN